MEESQPLKMFIKDEDLQWEIVDAGVRRKIISYDNNLMVVKVAFEKGGVGSLHRHYHSQITHVESGVFEIEINSEKRILNSGDAFYIPPNSLHGAVCKERGVLIVSLVL
jgi:quercetin dioxygenase-like cupin family protein